MCRPSACQQKRLLLTVDHLAKAAEKRVPCLRVVGPYHDMWSATNRHQATEGVTYVRIIIRLINYIVMHILCYVADTLQ